MTQSRRKGKAGELEFAALARECGWPDAARGQQHKGGHGAPDVTGLPPWLHPEVKCLGSGLPVYTALAQAQGDAGHSQTPVVFYRRVKRGMRRHPWVAVLLARDLLLMARKLEDLEEERSRLARIVEARRG